MTASVTLFDDIARTDEQGRVVPPPAILGLRNFEPNSEVPLFFTEFDAELLRPERLGHSLGIDGKQLSDPEAGHFDTAIGIPFPVD